MPRKLRTPKERVEELSPPLWHYLREGALPQRTEDPGWLEAFIVTAQEDRCAEIWAAIREPFLAQAIDECPGRRPHAWWTFDAPVAVPPEKWRDTCHAARWKDPRRRLGGIGTPCHDALNYAPYFAFGIPIHWVSAWQVAYYSGQSMDVHGKRIGEQYREGHFPYDAIDPGDPPQFESQAAYLARHGLLTPAERRRLPPDADEPEVLTLTGDDEGDAV